MSGFSGLPEEVRQTTTDIAEGVTTSVIKTSSKKIKDLAKKFKDRHLLFIQDNETVL